VLALLLSGPATAQGPRPPRPPAQPVPPQPLPPWEPELGKPFGPLPAPLARTAGEGPGLALSAAEGVRAASIPLGQPGLSFRYVQTFGVTEEAYPADSQHLNGPAGLFMDASNWLYVVEGNGHRVLRFNPFGTNDLILGHAGLPWHHDDYLSWPEEVAVDASGNIWVVFSPTIKKFDSSGNPVLTIPATNPWESGDDNYHFNDPWGIAFDSLGRLFVADTGNHRIQVYDVSGGTPVYVLTIGVTGQPKSDNTGFDQPTRLAFDDNGRLYVMDTANYRVQRCTRNPGPPEDWTCSTFFGVTGEPGDDLSHLAWARGITIRGSDVFIADSDNYRVLKCDLSGTCSRFAGTTGERGWDNAHFWWPDDVAVDSSGNVYVSDWDNHRVQKFNSAGTFLGTIGVTRVPYVTDATHLNTPWGIAVAPDGGIYVTEKWGYRLIKLNAAGVQQWAVGQAGVYGSDNAHFGDWWAGPEGNLAIDAAGRVYVPDTGNHRIQVFNPNGSFFTTFGSYGNGPYQFDCPAGVAISPVNGDIFVVDRCNQRIQVYTRDFVYRTTLGVLDETGTDNRHFNWPWGVAVDASGNIYVADTDNHRVQKCTLSGINYTCTTFAGETGVFGDDFGHLHPLAVAVDNAGRVYVADEWNSRVQVFDSTGAYLTTIGGAWDSTTGGMRGPSGVAVDSAGNVYVTDRDNHRIQKFAPGVPGWKQVNINGFGDVNNGFVSTLDVF
ncbi:MAG: 6-bladed beta-propeller, partial [Anaerolineae bacterium]